MSEDFILHYGHCHPQKSCRLLENHEKPTKARDQQNLQCHMTVRTLQCHVTIGANNGYVINKTCNIMWLFFSIGLYIWTYIYFIQFVMDFINDYCNQLLNKIFWFLFASCLKLFSSAFDITLIYGYTGIVFRATYH